MCTPSHNSLLSHLRPYLDLPRRILFIRKVFGTLPSSDFRQTPLPTPTPPHLFSLSRYISYSISVSLFVSLCFPVFNSISLSRTLPVSLYVLSVLLCVSLSLSVPPFTYSVIPPPRRTSLKHFSLYGVSLKRFHFMTINLRRERCFQKLF